MTTPPGLHVILAFGLEPADLRLLPGGQGAAWTDGRLVLKPVALAAEAEWTSGVFDGWSDSGQVRVPSPVRAEDGGWVHDGWAAHRWVVGRDVVPGRETDVVRRASDAFHDAVAALARPEFLDARSDPWSYGDRVAWDDALPQGNRATVGLIAEGLAALRPVQSPPQVIHGDIAGNVLVAEGLPPAVIDWPAYFRPAGFALAVAAADAICWSGAAPAGLLDAWSDVSEWNQLLLRAVIYRTATRGRLEVLDAQPRRSDPDSERYVEQVRPFLQAVLGRL